MHPILFKLGPLTFYSYGLMVALAFLAGAYLIWRNAPSYGVPRDKALDLLIIILIAGIIGGRALHVIVNIQYYIKHPLSIPDITSGGLAFYGGLVGGFVAAIWEIKRKRLPLYKTADLVAPYIALGQSIGRIGCFLNGCCFGKESSFGVIFPGDGLVRHPAQIYSSLGLLSVFLILRAASKKAPFEGGVFILYLLLYSTLRFFTDFFRADNPVYWPGLTLSQYISLFVFLGALLYYAGRLSLGKNIAP